jgi:GDPmannose 4,6-dehydratase
MDLNVSGLLRLLRIVERSKPDTRVYQASSSEIFGRAAGPCSETTPLAPTSPYGVSKMAAHRLCEVYRQRGLFVVSGILFNHESPRRAPEMVTRKITMAAARWVHGDRTRLRLGSLDARRDWGYAGDYVKAMRAMLQAPAPADYVIGSGESHSVGEFLATVLLEVREAYGITAFTQVQDCADTDPELLRSGEIRDLRADPRRAREDLGWKPEVEFTALARMMLHADVEAMRPASR